MIVIAYVKKGTGWQARAGIKGIMNRKMAKENGWQWLQQPTVITDNNNSYDQIKFETNTVAAKDFILGYLRSSPYWHG